LEQTRAQKQEDACAHVSREYSSAQALADLKDVLSHSRTLERQHAAHAAQLEARTLLQMQVNFAL